jgi:hypothetical protein
LPPGIEKIPSDWDLVVRCIGDHLTQIRGKIKNEVGGKTSIKNKCSEITKIEGSIEPDDTSQHLSLFDLADAVAGRCDATVTIEFLARVAILVRSSFLLATSCDNILHSENSYSKTKAAHSGTRLMPTLLT